MTTKDAAKRGVKIGVTEGPQQGKTFAQHKGPQTPANGDSVSERILNSPTLWPLVKFSPSGIEVLCVPNVFDVTNAEGTMEARREQVRTRCYFASLNLLTMNLGTIDLSIRIEYPQEPGSDTREGEDQFAQMFRERPG